MTDQTDMLFASHGLRCTKQRKALFCALAASKEHPTADELFRRVSEEMPSVSLATVYNTLEAFCRAGLAQKLPGVGQNGSARYDATCDDHLHLHCQRTGAVADVPDDISEQILKRIPADALRDLESQLGFKISQVQIQLVGEFTEQKDTRQAS